MTFVLSFILAAPLVGFIINSFSKKTAPFVGCSSSFISFIGSIYLFIITDQPRIVSLFSWIKIAALDLNFSFFLDSLSLIMMLVITGVGFLIHVFSLGYMEKDKGISRYFSYLNLFLFNMMILVLGNNLLLLFVGWEGVGLCSYLLIGFWFNQKEKAAAGMKAFITNRIGDAGFLIGIFLFFSSFQTLNFQVLETLNPQFSSLTAFLICFFFFIGAAGKSAQIPLYVWLPSAMAGPTPVSALIHAATMVTAGVYLIIRTKTLWLISDLAMNLVSVIGVSTALLGAYLACRVWDIKKILAYSTISQLGYMFLALGIGAFSTGFFHLITHAFFKACLFLSAGSLIHGLHGEQDIRFMGNQTRKRMPVSFISFLIGSIALMGLPPSAGFFSKDEILYHTFHEGHYVLWFLALLAACLTAFYTTKTLYFVFFKKTQKNLKAHEGGGFMNLPLIILSFLSLIAGTLNLPSFLPQSWPLQWLSQKIDGIQKITPSDNEKFLEILLGGSSVLLILVVAILSLYFLIRDQKPAFLSWVFSRSFSLDLFYKKYISDGVLKVSEILFTDIENNVIQRGVSSLKYYFAHLRKTFTSFQTGNVQDYVLFLGIGCLMFIFILIKFF